MNQLEQLRRFSGIVIDTGDIEAIAELQPEDATTNPSLLLKALQLPRYAELIEQTGRALQRAPCSPAAAMAEALDRLSVALGGEILQYIPGRVSTEVDARLSFDQAATLYRARRLIQLYEAQGIARERVLIKIAATWEGLQAARTLEQEGIACNLTLLFNLTQAEVAAQAGVTLISPFVGRILDWHQARESTRVFSAADDPGVRSVQAIHQLYKQQGYTTIIMAASFRNTQEILALAGCDKMTIAPQWLQELQAQHAPVTAALPEYAAAPSTRAALGEAEFRWAMNEDAMATEKLAEGIRLFTRDLRKLEDTLRRHWQPA